MIPLREPRSSTCYRYVFCSVLYRSRYLGTLPSSFFPTKSADYPVIYLVDIAYFEPGPNDGQWVYGYLYLVETHFCLSDRMDSYENAVILLTWHW